MFINKIKKEEEMTQKNTKTRNMIQLTVWDRKESGVEVVNQDFSSKRKACHFCNSRLMTISYMKWLKLEQKRITADPKRRAEIRNRGNKVALFVSPI